MQRSNVVLFGAIAILAIGLVASYVTRPSPGLDDVAVRSIVSEMIAEATPVEPLGPMSVGQVDAATLHPMIESYLLANPRILQRVSSALQAEIDSEEKEQAKVAIASIEEQIYDDPDHVILGNPNGDVTLVELFDYNCGYCRSAVADMATLLDQDPNLKIILKEFPILSQDSVDAHRIAIAVSRTDADYWEFHQTLFTSRGKITAESALNVAESLGLSRVSIDLDAKGDDISAILQRSYNIAQVLNVSGTPTYIIGNEVIPGAIGLDGLKQRIANMRECGDTVCGG